MSRFAAHECARITTLHETHSARPRVCFCIFTKPKPMGRSRAKASSSHVPNFKAVYAHQLPAEWRVEPTEANMADAAARLGVPRQLLRRRVVWLVPEHELSFAYQSFLASTSRDEGLVCVCIQASDTWAHESPPGSFKAWMNSMVKMGHPNILGAIFYEDSSAEASCAGASCAATMQQ